MRCAGAGRATQGGVASVVPVLRFYGVACFLNVACMLVAYQRCVEYVRTTEQTIKEADRDLP